MGDDDSRWSEARSLLDRTPTESAERRMRQSRRRTLLVVLAVSLLVGAPVGIGAVWLGDRSEVATSSADVPPWQQVAGLAVAGAGMLLLIVGIVAQFRANRRTSAWRSPLYALTQRQRKELLAAVRGQVSVDPDRLPLARHLASNLLEQQHLVLILVGQAVLWTGFLVADPSWWRAALAGLFLVTGIVSLLMVWRQQRHARRFLAEHPPGEPG